MSKDERGADSVSEPRRVTWHSEAASPLTADTKAKRASARRGAFETPACVQHRIVVRARGVHEAPRDAALSHHSPGDAHRRTRCFASFMRSGRHEAGKREEPWPTGRSAPRVAAPAAIAGAVAAAGPSALASFAGAPNRLAGRSAAAAADAADDAAGTRPGLGSGTPWAAHVAAAAASTAAIPAAAVALGTSRQPGGSVAAAGAAAAGGGNVVGTRAGATERTAASARATAQRRSGSARRSWSSSSSRPTGRCATRAGASAMAAWGPGRVAVTGGALATAAGPHRGGCCWRCDADGARRECSGRRNAAR
mmetsp:Transcript_31389/g.96962  ORF Transcript_31389/g.96962 Transcript_31389/m.96962 type:complete len:309 (-) Transcript_31389:241-1167(-)